MRGARFLLCAAALHASALTAAAPTPSPQHGPREVVGHVLRALAHPDRPTANAGIATTFDFASPANRRRTGPLARFIRLLENPRYAPLLGHERALRGETVVDGDSARERVRVIGDDGAMAVYVFLLARQPEEGECGRCWMTDAVIRVQPAGTAT